MKAIVTEWKGYKFRSRLEARWAVFFDGMRLDWDYEPQGFHINGFNYLPDFRVMTPQGKECWYEIKPKNVTTDAKFKAFAEAIDKKNFYSGYGRTSLLHSDPMYYLFERTPSICFCPRCGYIGTPAAGDYQDAYGCHPCDFETPIGDGHPEEIGVCHTIVPHSGMVICTADSVEWRLSLLYDNAKRARSARFEYGESP